MLLIGKLTQIRLVKLITIGATAALVSIGAFAQPASATVYPADGTLDTTFTGTGFTFASPSFSPRVRNLVVQNDGKVLAVGDFTLYNGVAAPGIVRLNADGSRDATFSVNSGASSGAAVNTVRVQSDGKYIVAGSFTSFNGVSRNYITRLNTDGSVDTSFTSPFSGNQAQVLEMAINSDDSIIIVGTFSGVDSAVVGRVAKLSKDGVFDTDFQVNLGTGANSTVTGVLRQTDGKLIIFGSFSSFSGQPSSGLLRILADGLPDFVFSQTSAFPSMNVTDVALQSDNKLVVAGRASYNNVVTPVLTRLEASGTIDTTFNQGGAGFLPPTAGSTEPSVDIAADGKIYVGGNFVNYNNTVTNQLFRIDSTGALDSSFSVGSGFSRQTNPDSRYVVIEGISFLNNGDLLVLGDFSAYKGTGVGNIIRITSTEAIAAAAAAASAPPSTTTPATTTPVLVTPSTTTPAPTTPVSVTPSTTTPAPTTPATTTPVSVTPSTTTPAPTTPAARLATTGANVEWLMVTGLLVAIAGSGFLAFSRRKRIW